MKVSSFISGLRRRLRARGLVLAAAVLLALMPFWLAANGAFRESVSNKAMAATNAAAIDGGPFRKFMSSADRGRRARALRQDIGGRPDEMLDLKEEDILLVFSVPALKRMDGATSVWQYRSPDCILDIYFTPGESARKGKEKTRVSWYELRGRDKAVLYPEDRPEGQAQDPDSCLRSLFDEPARG